MPIIFLGTPDINAYSAPQHGSAAGPTITHMEANYQPFHKNRCPQVGHVSVHKLPDLITLLLTISTILTTNSCRYTIILKESRWVGATIFFLKIIHGTPQMSIFDCVSHPVGTLEVCENS